MGIVDCICSNWQKMDFPALQFIISVTLHVCPLICATKEKQTMIVKVASPSTRSRFISLLQLRDRKFAIEYDQGFEVIVQKSE